MVLGGIRRRAAAHSAIWATVTGRSSTAAWAIYAVLLPDGIDRATVQDTLRAEGVPTAIYYPRPLHRQPAYRDHHDGAALPTSDYLADRILALPIHPDMDEAAACHVCDAVVAAVARRK